MTTLPVNFYEMLKKYNVDIILINAIKEIYDQNKCQNNAGTKLSKCYKTCIGLLEGCNLSRTLFKINL